MDGPAGRLAYGEILLETLRHASASVPYGAVGMGESLRNLKWRLTMIGRTRTPAARTAWAFLLPALALAAAVLPLPAQGAPGGSAAPAPAADDPEKAAALAAMLPWLALEDKGDHGTAWDQASPQFQKAVSRADWIATAGRVRPPLGKCLERPLASANVQVDPSFNGAVDKGVFVMAQFDSRFENLKYAMETVCFRKAADGTWRAEGYFIKPRD